MVTRSYFRISFLGLFLWSILLSWGHAFSETGNHRNEVEADNREMGIKRPESGGAWKAADRILKRQFEQAYLSAHDPREVFQEYLGTLGAEAMLDYLELRSSRCHGEAHDLGRAIFDHVNDVGTALQVCGNRCTNACMHGVVSEAFGHSGYREVTNQMSRFCQGNEMASLHKPGNCAHGIGHALMILTQQDIGKSLESCSFFPTVGMDYYCATGVFMEYWGQLEDEEELGHPVTRQSLHYPCDTYSRFPAACYRYIIRRMAYELDADRERLTEECLGLKNGLRRGCFHGLGAMYSRRVAAHPSLLPALCLQGSTEDQILCVEGVIEKMADFNEAEALAACAVLKGKPAEVCLAAAKGKMYRLNKSTMRLYREVGSLSHPE